MPYRMLVFVVVGLLAGCPGGGSGGGADAALPPDASPPADAAPPDASPPPSPSGHAGTAIVPAGATSTSTSYKFVGTLSAGGEGASPQHTVRSGVVGATQ